MSPCRRLWSCAIVRLPLKNSHLACLIGLLFLPMACSLIPESDKLINGVQDSLRLSKDYTSSEDQPILSGLEPHRQLPDLNLMSPEHLLSLQKAQNFPYATPPSLGVWNSKPFTLPTRMPIKHFFFRLKDTLPANRELRDAVVKCLGEKLSVSDRKLLQEGTCDVDWKDWKQIQAINKMEIKVQNAPTNSYGSFSKPYYDLDKSNFKNVRLNLLYMTDKLAGCAIWKSLDGLEADENKFLNELQEAWDVHKQEKSAKTMDFYLPKMLHAVEYSNKAILLRISRLDQLFETPFFSSPEQLFKAQRSAFKYMCQVWRSRTLEQIHNILNYNIKEQQDQYAPAFRKLFSINKSDSCVLCPFSWYVFDLWVRNHLPDSKHLLLTRETVSAQVKEAMIDIGIKEAIYNLNKDIAIKIFPVDFKLVPRRRVRSSARQIDNSRKRTRYTEESKDGTTYTVKALTKHIN
ncbi:hypothetical protein O181_042709 [Austropuccinia psidii MF-1]|uniref:RNA-directed RNA polymerase n=1 Tax=Austropuccinia psidii MF-1 TaxID=1389203 RepID=A0A9Q3DGX9_9BASI|nr:hypothetical protein [Austropuccinia psidii MF-1]